MKLCINCNKFGDCELASEHITYCEKFNKRSYETKLVKIEDGTYYFEEIK